MDSHIDEFGRTRVSRDDRERLTLQWNRRHGMPTDSGHVIAREQWVAQTVAAQLRARRTTHWPVHSLTMP